VSQTISDAINFKDKKVVESTPAWGTPACYALWNREAIIFLPCDFYLSSSFW